MPHFSSPVTSSSNNNKVRPTNKLNYREMVHLSVAIPNRLQLGYSTMDN